MSSRSTNRVLIFIIAVLLISNVAMLVFFMSKTPGEKRESEKKPGWGMAETLKKEAAFDDQQVREYERLREEHWEKMKPMFHDMQATKSSFYQLVRDTTLTDSAVAVLAGQIGEKQKAIDFQIFQHFKKVRGLCRPEQKAKFDSIYQGTVKRMSGGRGGPGGPKKADSIRANPR
jgi:protein CpxP